MALCKELEKVGKSFPYQFCLMLQRRVVFSSFCDVASKDINAMWLLDTQSKEEQACMQLMMLTLRSLCT